jgi:hypothetical protein
MLGERPVTLERSIDQGVVRWAHARWPDMVVRKLSTLGAHGSSGDPDRLFFWKSKLLLIEMKAPGGTCTPLQLQRHAEWRAAGAEVSVVADVAVGRAVLLQFFEGRKRQYSGAAFAGP